MLVCYITHIGHCDCCQPNCSHMQIAFRACFLFQVDPVLRLSCHAFNIIIVAQCKQISLYWSLLQTSIILKLMLELPFSVIALLFFTLSTAKPDKCYYLSLILNILHLSLYSLILLPLIMALIRKKSLANIKREYLKVVVISSCRMATFCCGMLALSLFCLYAMIVELFVWENYAYLFTVFCLVCSSLTTVANYVKVKYDCSLFFAVETYKFFCLAVSSIMFGISAHEARLSAEILGMGWSYFVYRSKQSLPREIVYYLILFVDVVILSTAIMVIGSSQSMTREEHQTKSKFTLIFSVTFFALLFSMEIYDFVQLYRNFGRYSNESASKQVDITQIYLKMQELQKNKPRVMGVDNPEEEMQCSICLERIKDKPGKGEQLILTCGHVYHSGCLEQWVEINQTCPMCRKHLLSDFQESVSI